VKVKIMYACINTHVDTPEFHNCQPLSCLYSKWNNKFSAEEGTDVGIPISF
jgi:hypothetical protein